MNSGEFRRAAHSAVDESKLPIHREGSYTNKLPVIDYYDNIQQRRVVSDVTPGYLRKLLPSNPPEEGEEWADIQKDIESKIMPGLTHWYLHTPVHW